MTNFLCRCLTVSFILLYGSIILAPLAVLLVATFIPFYAVWRLDDLLDQANGG